MPKGWPAPTRHFDQPAIHAMKIRMQGNSIRLRLSQTEVLQLQQSGRVAGRVEFGTTTLTYALEKSPAKTMNARFAEGKVTVFVPEAKAEEWASTDLVGLEHTTDLGTGKSLRILVEKDFKCLTVGPGEDESDNFENPNGAC
jgi:uncharacterized protein DUF7009